MTLGSGRGAAQGDRTAGRGIGRQGGRVESLESNGSGNHVYSHSQIKSPIQNGIKMAGKPGMKGGGGARAGSGRKPQPKEEKRTIPASGQKTPLEFLLDVMNDSKIEDRLRIDAAKTAAQYVHMKKGDGGIKDEKAEAAKKAGVGKFAAGTAPKLVAVKK